MSNRKVASSDYPIANCRPFTAITANKAFRILITVVLFIMAGAHLMAQTPGVTGSNQINKCETKTYTITILNNSGNPLTNLVIANNISLLTGFSYVNGSASIWVNSNPAFCTANPSIGGSVLTWNINTLCSTTFTLNNGETLSISFDLQTDCSAVSGSMNVHFTYDIGSTPSYDDTAFSIQVLPGGVTIKKTPNVIPQEVGQNITWTLTIENTGLGTIKNVFVTDVLGSGLQYVSSSPSGTNAGQTTTWDSSPSQVPEFASMDPGDIVTIDITALVIACTGLDNTADVRWGCDAGHICFDTANDGGTATASVQHIVKTPNTSFTPPNITFTYCNNTSANSLTITNIGDGTAHDFKLHVDFSPLTVVASSVLYNAGGYFEIPDIAAGGHYDLTFTLQYTTWCGGSDIAKSLVWIPQYKDDCGNDFYPPVEVSTINSVAGRPSLSVSKTGASEVIQIGDQVTYNITSSYSGDTSCGSGNAGEVTVVDTLPDGFTVLDADGGTWVPGTGGTGGTVTWTYTPPATLTKTLILQSPLMSDCEMYCHTTFTNTVNATGLDCCGCTLNANASETSAIQCQELATVDKTATPSTIERCTDVLYANTYTFATTANVNLNDLVFEDLANNSQQSVPSSLSVIFDGVDITGSVVVTDTTPGGVLHLDFSGCSAISVNNKVLVISYEMTITTATAAACADSGFLSWSSMQVGPGGGSNCLAGGIIYQAVPVSVEAPAMSVDISGLPRIVDKCKTQTVTITLTQTSTTANPRDARLVLSGLNYYVVNPSATVCGGTVSPVSCTPTLVGNDYVWTFDDRFAGAGQTTTLQLSVQKRCTGTGDLVATAYFDDKCNDDATPNDTCSTSDTDTPAMLLSADLLIEKTPEVYYAATNSIQWKVYVTNRGTGTAYNVWVDDVLGSGLAYDTLNPATVNDMTGVTVTANQNHGGGAINGANIAIALMLAGERREITFNALLVSCTNLTNDATTSWGCVSVDCQTPISDNSTVEIPAPLLVNTNVVITPINICTSPSATVTLRNAGQTTCYNLQITETLPTGLTFALASTRWRLNGGGWNGPNASYNPNPTVSPIRWTKTEISALSSVNPGDTIEIEFWLSATCPFNGGQVTVSTQYENPCGQVFTNADSAFAVTLQAPVISVTKTRVNQPIGCSESVTWTITVTNSSAYALPVLWIEDTLGGAFTFFSSTGDPTYGPADNGYHDSGAPQVVQWEIKNLPVGAHADLTVTATTDSSPSCNSNLDDTVNVWWGCGDTDGLSSTKPPLNTPGCASCCLATATVTTTRTETREPEVGFLNVNINPTSISSCDDHTELTLTINNTGPTDASDVDLVVTLPPGLSYITNSTSLSCTSAAPAPAGNPAITGGGLTLTFYDIGSKASNLCDTLQAAGKSDTITLVFSVRSNCYPTSDIGFRLYYYDCCGDTQYDTTSSQTITSQYPNLSITKVPTTSQVACSAQQSWTITVTNNGTGNAEVVRIEDTLGNWIDYVSTNPAATMLGGDLQRYGWEINNLGPSSSVVFTITGTLNPDSFPNQADCTAALRQNNARAIWGCGSNSAATDGNPNTMAYDCTYGTWANASVATLQMPDLIVQTITPSITCTADGSFSGSISVTVRNQGDGTASGGFTVSIVDGHGWTGTGTYSSDLGAGSSTVITINVATWAPSCTHCTYNFTATVDSTAAVCECNESNNTGTLDYTPTIPDIVVDSENLTIGCSGNADGQVLISGTVKLRNSGCGNALTTNVPMRFTLHGAGSCGGSVIGVPWAQNFTGVNIAPGTTQTFTITNHTITTNICTGSTGCTASIFIEADYNNSICECNGDNNTLCSSDKTISIPDIVVDADTFAVACLSDGNVQTTGTFTLRNDGCGILNVNVPVRFRMYSASGCGGSQLDQWTQTFAANINPGSSQVFTITARNHTQNLCTSSTGCVISFQITPDYGGTICECSSTSNAYCSANKSVSIPDIQVSNDTLGVSCVSDGHVRVSGTVTLQNSGCGSDLTASVPVRFTVFGNSDCTGTQIAQWTETFTGVGIAAGGGTQSFTISNNDITTNMCSGSTSCQFSIRIEADYDSQICECSSINNTRCSNKTLSIPDLTISSVTPLYTCSSDGSVTGSVTVNVANSGCAAVMEAVVRLTSSCGYTFSDQKVDLSAGGNSNLTFNFTPLQSICSCTFTATVDPDSAICECNGTNNSLPSVYNAQLPEIEAVSETLAVACAADGQGQVTGSVTLRKSGCGTLTTSIPMQFTMYNAPGCSGGQVTQWTQTFTGVSIAAGATQVFNITAHTFTANLCTSSTSCQVSIQTIADYNGSICEWNGGSHQLCNTKTIAIPDLAVTAVTPSVVCNSDGNLTGTVSVVVANTGCTDVSGAVVRLTSDCGYTFSDQTVNLAHGDSTTLTFNFTPDKTRCTCTFTATIDPDHAICECSGTNNSGSAGPYTIQVPDIQVSGQNVTLTASANGQVLLSGTVTLANSGCGNALTTDIPIRFTLFNTAGCTGTQIDQWTENFSSVNLSPGGTQIFTITNHLINTNMCTAAAACQVSLRIEADYNNSICEFSGGNNTLCADKSVDVPDITVPNDTLTVSCTSDGHARISGAVALSNIGCGSPLTTDVHMRFTVYDHAGCTGNQIAEWTQTFTGVNIGINNSQSFTIAPFDTTINFCANSTGCQVSILITANDGDIIHECSGGNNTRCTDKPISIPDLAITSVTPAATCISTGNVTGTVIVIVANNGCAAVTGAVVRLISDIGYTFSDQTVNLAAGATATLTFTFIPDTSRCTGNFTATIDPDDAVCECTANNNSMQVAYTNLIPDLSITGFQVTCMSDGQYSVAVTIDNNGCGSATSIPIRLVDNDGHTQTLIIPSMAGHSQMVVTFAPWPSDGIPPTLNFIVTIDPLGTVCQLTNTDKTYTTDYTRPDLKLTQISPECISKGHYRVTFLVENVGSEVVNLPFYMRLSDNDGHVSDVLFTSIGGHLPFGPGTSQTIIFDNWIVDCDPSIVVFTGLVDSHLEICDGNLPNNTNTASLSIIDLVTAAVSPTTSCSADGAISGTIGVTITNHGGAPWPNDFSISVTDGMGWSSDLRYSADLGGTLPIAAGASVTVSIPWTRQFTTTPYICDYPTITVTADSHGEVCECSDANNTLTGSCHMPYPDLVPQTMAATCASDGVLSLALTVINQGCADVTSDFNILITDSAKLSRTYSFTSIGGKLPLLVNVPQTISVNNWAYTCGSSRLDFTVSLDTGATVCEMSGSNNSLSWIYNLDEPNLLIGDTTWNCSADGTITFNVAIVNNGYGTATGVTFSAFDEKGLVYSQPVTVKAGGTTIVTFTAGPYAGNVEHTFRFTIETANKACECSGAQHEGSIKTKCSAQPPALVTEKTSSTSRANACGEIEFTLRIQNVGAGDALNVTVTDILPNGFTYVRGSTVATWPSGRYTSDPAISGQTLVWKTGARLVGGIPVGETLILKFRAHAGSCKNGGGKLTNQMEATAVDASGKPIPKKTTDPDDDDIDDASSIDITLACPHLKTERTCPSITQISAGGVLEYTITIANDGDPESELTQAIVRDDLPAGWKLVSFTSDGGTPVTAPTSGSTGNLVWNYGNVKIVPGSPIKLTVRIQPDQSTCGTTFRDTVRVTAQDDCHETNYAGDPQQCPVNVVCGEPLLELEKICPTAQQPGGIYRYEVIVRNRGNSDIRNVMIKDELPSPFDYVPGSSALDGRQIEDPAITGRLLVWSLGTLHGKTEMHLIYTAIVPADAEPGRYCNGAWVEGADESGAQIKTDRRECCVITRRGNAQCCLRADENVLGFFQEPEQYISFIDPYFRTESAMFTCYASLDMWQRTKTEIETPAHFYKERLKNYALATIEEFYLRSKLGMTLDDGSLLLSRGGARPEKGDNGWTDSRTDKTMTVSQMAFELLALNRAVQSEDKPDLQAKLRRLIEERIRFLQPVSQELPHSWTVEKNKADKGDGKATLDDLAALNLALTELEKAGYTGARPIKQDLQKGLEPLNTNTIDKDKLVEELYYALALIEAGDTEHATAKMKQFSSMYNGGEIKFDHLYPLALASYVDFRAGGTSSEKLFDELKKRFSSQDTNIFAEQQTDFTYKVDLRDSGAVILAFEPRLVPQQEFATSTLYRMFDETGMFLQEKDLIAGSSPLLMLRNYPLSDQMLPILSIEKGGKNIAAVFTEDALVRSPRSPQAEEDVFPNSFSKVLSPGYEQTTSGIATLSYQAQYLGRQLMLHSDRTVQESGRSLDEFGKRYAVAMLDSGAGNLMNETTVVPSAAVADKGIKEGEFNLQSIRGTALYRAADLADYLVAEKLYLDGHGRRSEDMRRTLELQRRIVAKFKEIGYVPDQFSLYISSDGKDITLLPSKEKAEKVTSAKLLFALDDDFLKQSMETQTTVLTPKDLFFLSMAPEASRYFEKEIKKFEEEKKTSLEALSAAVLSRRLIRQNDLEATKALLDKWDDEIALPRTDRNREMDTAMILNYEPQDIFLYLLATQGRDEFKFKRTLSIFGSLLESEWGLRWDGAYAMLPPSEFWVIRESQKQSPEPGDILTMNVRVENRCPLAAAGSGDIPSVLIRASFDPRLIYAGTNRNDDVQVLRDFTWAKKDLFEGGLLEFTYHALVPREFMDNFIDGRLTVNGYTGYEAFGPESAAGVWCDAVADLRRVPITPLARMKGVVFLDENLNGVRDPGEKGIPGILLKDSQGRLCRSDAEGVFFIDTGSEKLGVQIELKSVPARFVLTTDTTRLVDRNITGEISFGLVECVRVEGFVYEDLDSDGKLTKGEPTVEGVIVKAVEKEVTSSANGRFIFRNLPIQWRDRIGVGDQQPFIKQPSGNLKIHITAVTAMGEAGGK